MNINLLKEVVQYTTSIDLDLVKITGTDKLTQLEAISSDKSVVLKAQFHSPITEFQGTLGLPNLGRLNVILNIPEYRENPQINTTKNSTGELETIVFKNQSGDFTNVYRLMSSSLVNSMVSSVTFREPSWNLEFEPVAQNIQKFRYQSQALNDSVHFQTYTRDSKLYLEFGDSSSHNGTFVFHEAVTGKLTGSLSWPVKQVLAILNLVGDKKIRISDAGALQITVDSGVAVYQYIIPTQKK